MSYAFAYLAEWRGCDYTYEGAPGVLGTVGTWAFCMFVEEFGFYHVHRFL